MQERGTSHQTVGNGASSSVHDLLAIGFRQRRLVVVSFVAVFLVVILVILLLPKEYESQMKILVRRERVDPVVSANQNTPIMVSEAVSEEQMQSESELLISRDLLEKVVITCGLLQEGKTTSWTTSWLRSIRSRLGRTRNSTTKDAERIAGAILDLKERITAEPIRKTNLISVTYRGKDPQAAANVLRTLATLYLEKHLALQRPPGAYDFFQQQTEAYRQALERTQARLADFTRTEGVVSGQLEKEIAVRKLGDAEAQLRETQASIQETEERVQTLRKQLNSVPSRRVSQIRTTDNPQLMQQLKGILLNLELKRTELLTKFDPSYMVVREVDGEIAQTRAAIEAAEKEPLRDETTDRDPTYEWITAELAKAASELSALRARETATSATVRAYRENARRLDQKEIAQADLLREAKAEEDTYLLYQHKMEEARISDALDRQQIANVVIAEPASVPVQPISNRALVLLTGGLLLACFVSAAAALIADRADATLRTPDEVRMYLNAPVVAAIPKGGDRMWSS